MNREILFKGRRVDGGSWTEGYYSRVIICESNSGEKVYAHFIVSECGVEREVDPDTVGQYTGLKDKNGVRIFEGDVASLITADGEVITVECRFGNVRQQIFENLVEIIGNIHDTPEATEETQ